MTLGRTGKQFEADMSIFGHSHSWSLRWTEEIELIRADHYDVEADRARRLVCRAVLHPLFAAEAAEVFVDSRISGKNVVPFASLLGISIWTPALTAVGTHALELVCARYYMLPEVVEPWQLWHRDSLQKKPSRYKLLFGEIFCKKFSFNLIKISINNSLSQTFYQVDNKIQIMHWTKGAS